MDYKLYYWAIPFRGQFVRAVLAQAGATWTEASFDEVRRQRAAAPGDQIVAHMGPPLLTDLHRDVHLSQLPAILDYLGGRHGLMPTDPHARAMCHKAIGDANDVLAEITRHNGERRWTPDEWAGFVPRLERWMTLFEVTGQRHGLAPDEGYFLGTGEPCLADLVTATLWGTMTAKLTALRPLLEARAPSVAGLCDRIGALPAQAALREKSDALYGDAWCGGQIEASLRAVLSGGPE